MNNLQVHFHYNCYLVFIVKRNILKRSSWSTNLFSPYLYGNLFRNCKQTVVTENKPKLYLNVGFLQINYFRGIKWWCFTSKLNICKPNVRKINIHYKPFTDISLIKSLTLSIQYYIKHHHSWHVFRYYVSSNYPLNRICTKK